MAAPTLKYPPSMQGSGDNLAGSMDPGIDYADIAGNLAGVAQMAAQSQTQQNQFTMQLLGAQMQQSNDLLKMRMMLEDSSQTRFVQEQDAERARSNELYKIRVMENESVLQRLREDREARRQEFQQTVEFLKIQKSNELADLQIKSATLDLALKTQESERKIDAGKAAYGTRDLRAQFDTAVQSDDLAMAIGAYKAYTTSPEFGKLDESEKSRVISTWRERSKQAVTALDGSQTTLGALQKALDAGSQAERNKALATLKRNGTRVDQWLAGDPVRAAAVQSLADAAPETEEGRVAYRDLRVQYDSLLNDANAIRSVIGKPKPEGGTYSVRDAEAKETQAAMLETKMASLLPAGGFAAKMLRAPGIINGEVLGRNLVAEVRTRVASAGTPEEQAQWGAALDQVAKVASGIPASQANIATYPKSAIAAFEAVENYRKEVMPALDALGLSQTIEARDVLGQQTLDKAAGMSTKVPPAEARNAQKTATVARLVKLSEAQGKFWVQGGDTKEFVDPASLTNAGNLVDYSHEYFARLTGTINSPTAGAGARREAMAEMRRWLESGGASAFETSEGKRVSGRNVGMLDASDALMGVSTAASFGATGVAARLGLGKSAAALAAAKAVPAAVTAAELAAFGPVAGATTGAVRDAALKYALYAGRSAPGFTSASGAAAAKTELIAALRAADSALTEARAAGVAAKLAGEAEVALLKNQAALGAISAASAAQVAAPGLGYSMLAGRPSDIASAGVSARQWWGRGVDLGDDDVYQEVAKGQNFAAVRFSGIGDKAESADWVGARDSLLSSFIPVLSAVQGDPTRGAALGKLELLESVMQKTGYSVPAMDALKRAEQAGFVKAAADDEFLSVGPAPVVQIQGAAPQVSATAMSPVVKGTPAP